MRRRLAEDLAAWEAGEVSLEEIEARRPGLEVRTLVDLHERLRALTVVATPDPETSWASLSGMLPGRDTQAVVAPHAARGSVEMVSPANRRHVRRTLVAAIAAVMLLGSAALAAPGAVRAGVDVVRGAVESLLGSGAEPAMVPSRVPAVSPTIGTPSGGPSGIVSGEEPGRDRGSKITGSEDVTRSGDGSDSQDQPGDVSDSQARSGDGSDSQDQPGDGSDSQARTGDGSDSQARSGDGSDSQAQSGDGSDSQAQSGDGSDSQS
jgi:hypothetical protein